MANLEQQAQQYAQNKWNWNVNKAPPLPPPQNPPLPGAPPAEGGEPWSSGYNQWDSSYNNQYPGWSGYNWPPQGNNWNQLYNSQPAAPPGQPPPPTNAPPPAQPPLPYDESSDPEIAEFDKQFKDWEKKFEEWKEENKNHPDKAALSNYEETWTKWKDDLLQKREDIKKKKVAAISKNFPAALPAMQPPALNWNQPPTPWHSSGPPPVNLPNAPTAASINQSFPPPQRPPNPSALNSGQANNKDLPPANMSNVSYNSQKLPPKAFNIQPPDMDARVRPQPSYHSGERGNLLTPSENYERPPNASQDKHLNMGANNAGYQEPPQDLNYRGRGRGRGFDSRRGRGRFSHDFEENPPLHPGSDQRFLHNRNARHRDFQREPDRYEEGSAMTSWNDRNQVRPNSSQSPYNHVSNADHNRAVPEFNKPNYPPNEKVGGFHQDESLLDYPVPAHERYPRGRGHFYGNERENLPKGHFGHLDSPGRFMRRPGPPNSMDSAHPGDTQEFSAFGKESKAHVPFSNLSLSLSSSGPMSHNRDAQFAINSGDGKLNEPVEVRNSSKFKGPPLPSDPSSKVNENVGEKGRTEVVEVEELFQKPSSDKIPGLDVSNASANNSNNEQPSKLKDSKSPGNKKDETKTFAKTFNPFELGQGTRLNIGPIGVTRTDKWKPPEDWYEDEEESESKIDHPKRPAEANPDGRPSKIQNRNSGLPSLMDISSSYVHAEQNPQNYSSNNKNKMDEFGNKVDIPYGSMSEGAQQERGRNYGPNKSDQSFYEGNNHGNCNDRVGSWDLPGNTVFPEKSPIDQDMRTWNQPPQTDNWEGNMDLGPPVRDKSEYSDFSGRGRGDYSGLPRRGRGDYNDRQARGREVYNDIPAQDWGSYNDARARGRRGYNDPPRGDYREPSDLDQGEYNIPAGRGRGDFRFPSGRGRGDYNNPRHGPQGYSDFSGGDQDVPLRRDFGDYSSNPESDRDEYNAASGRGRGGYDNSSGRGRGGYDNLSGRGRGGYDSPSGRGRGGYDNPSGRGRGGYDNPSGRGRGGYDNPSGRGRGGYDNPSGRGRGGYDNTSERGRGGYDNPSGRGRGGGFNLSGRGRGGGDNSSGHGREEYDDPKGRGRRGYSEVRGRGKGSYNNLPGHDRGGYNDRQESNGFSSRSGDFDGRTGKSHSDYDERVGQFQEKYSQFERDGDNSSSRDSLGTDFNMRQCAPMDYDGRTERGRNAGNSSRRGRGDWGGRGHRGPLLGQGPSNRNIPLERDDGRGLGISRTNDQSGNVLDPAKHFSRESVGSHHSFAPTAVNDGSQRPVNPLNTTDRHFNENYNQEGRISQHQQSALQDSPMTANEGTLDGNDESSAETTTIDDLIGVPGRFMRPPKLVIVFRGLPGSGKTTLAKMIKDKEIENGGSAPRILCLDDYFMVESEKIVTDVETGRKTKAKTMEYEYEPELEDSYRAALVKSFKKQVDEKFFPFIIIDCINSEVKHFRDMCNYAKKNGFEPYVAQVEGDKHTCAQRNLHHRKLEDLEKLSKKWEKTPIEYTRLDLTSYIQDANIQDVQMEDSVIEIQNDQKDDIDDDDAGSFSIVSQLIKSKWDNMESQEAKLDKLDGVKAAKKRIAKSKPQNIEDWLQLNEEFKDRKDQPGKKRVKWADIEERKKQEAARERGFIVGQTDWQRMTDPSLGSSALVQVRYIERVRQ